MNEELKIIISAEIAKAQKNLKDIQDEVEKLGDEGKKSSKKFNDSMKEAGDASSKMAGVVKSAMGAIAVGITAAAASLVAITESTREYRTEQAKLTTAFESAGGSADTAKTAYNDLYRVLGDGGQATEAAAHLAQLTTNEKELSEWTNICQGVYATFGDSLPIEGLTEAANETAKVGQVTGGLADALNWAGISEDDFNAKLEACNSEAEREKLIRETLNGVYDKASKNYEENAKDILASNEAQAKLTDSLASLGETMEPIITAFKTFLAEGLEKVTPYLQQLAEEYGPLLEEALTAIGEAIGEVISWIVDNWELISTIATIVGAIAAAILLVNGAIAAYNIVMGICNAVMAASPITWIIAGIVALVAAIILCIVYWEEIMAVVQKVWDAIVGAIQAAIDWIVEAFNNVVNFFKENWQALLLLLVNPFAGAFKLLYDNCEGFRNFIDDLVKKIGQFFSNLWEGIKKTFSSVGTWFKNVFQGAWNGIKNVFSAVGSFFGGIWNTIKEKFTNIGQKIGDAVGGAFKKAVNAVLGTAVKIINGFISAINWAIDVINKIPGVNLSKLSSLEVPQLARGGVIDSATLAVVGEQGKEAVVPLENNLGWLDKLAGMLNERMGGTSGPIVLQVDGKTFAQVTCGEINKLTRQTGSLPLVIA